MPDNPLLPPAFIRRNDFMLGPLRAGRALPGEVLERQYIIIAARDWLGRFVALATEMREWLLSRVLNLASSAQSLDLPPLHATTAPIPGWDLLSDSPHLPITESLFDPETIERIIYLSEQLAEDATQAFFRELALLAIDRLDLIITLLQDEYNRLENL